MGLAPRNCSVVSATSVKDPSSGMISCSRDHGKDSHRSHTHNPNSTSSNPRSNSYTLLSHLFGKPLSRFQSVVMVVPFRCWWLIFLYQKKTANFPKEQY